MIRIPVRQFLVLVFVLMVPASLAAADVISDASSIGANAGAMSYCKDHVASDDDRSKYSLLSIKTMEAYNELSDEDKVKALVMKKAAEDGEYLGKPLDEDRCDSLRKTLFLKYRD